MKCFCSLYFVFFILQSPVYSAIEPYNCREDLVVTSVIQIGLASSCLAHADYSAFVWSKDPLFTTLILDGDATLEGAQVFLYAAGNPINSSAGDSGTIYSGPATSSECYADIIANGFVDPLIGIKCQKTTFWYDHMEKTCDACLNLKSKALPDSGNNDCPNTPVLIDLAGNGFHLNGTPNQVFFDFDGDGLYTFTQWVRPNQDDGFLFLDLDGNGIVDNGKELFGNHTPLLLKDGDTKTYQGSRPPNGYAALSQYDHQLLGGNQDNNISAADEVFGDLKIWVDANGDGICSTGEVTTLASHQVKSISLKPKANFRRDQSGNRYYLWSWAWNSNGKKVKTTDIWFQPGL